MAGNLNLNVLASFGKNCQSYAWQIKLYNYEEELVKF